MTTMTYIPVGDGGIRMRIGGPFSVVLLVGMCSISGGFCCTAEEPLGAWFSGCTFPLSPRGASERASRNRALILYESMPVGSCIRLDAIVADAGAGGDDDGNTEALGRSKDG